MSSAAPHVVCSVCKRKLQVRDDGMIRSHRTLGSAGDCDGSGKPGEEQWWGVDERDEGESFAFYPTRAEAAAEATEACAVFRSRRIRPSEMLALRYIAEKIAEDIGDDAACSTAVWADAEETSAHLLDGAAEALAAWADKWIHLDAWEVPK